jgi:hypothetical protein
MNMLRMNALLKIDLQLSQKEYEYLMELLINSAKEDLDSFLRYDFMYKRLDDQAIACNTTSNAINIMKQINDSTQSSVSDVGTESVLKFFMKKDEELFNFVNEEEIRLKELNDKASQDSYNRKKEEHVQS